MSEQNATGIVVKAYGNLLQVRFEGHIRQGEVAGVEVDGQTLKAEVIEILGNEAKIQVYEDTRGVGFGTKVVFSEDLLEAELGPGLLQSVVDGLQNPLENLAEVCGFFLTRGVYIPPINREKTWEFTPVAKVGDQLKRGDLLGTTPEAHFTHQIMVPFSFYGKVTLSEVASAGKYTVDQMIAKGKDESGREHVFTMMQKWPIKNALLEGTKIKASKMMSCGLRTIDTQFPLVKGGSFCSPGPLVQAKQFFNITFLNFQKLI
ncbi:MAG: V-type ATP synthase alpha chain [Chlamydiae bacterium]|nr:V-type ATP synthase alpha chain [Chlamydiota bacterium]